MTAPESLTGVAPSTTGEETLDTPPTKISAARSRPEKRSCRMHYRDCRIPSAFGELSGLLQVAIGNGSLVEDRDEGLTSSTHRFIGDWSVDDETFFGALMGFTEGHQATMIRFDPKQPKLSLEALKSSEAGVDYIHQALYFLARGNHVVFVPFGGAMGHYQLENHFDWLLRKRGQVLPPQAQTVRLFDVPSMALRQRWQGVSSVSLVASLSEEEVETTAGGGPKAMRRLINAAREAFQDSEGLPARMDLCDAKLKHALNLKMEISLKGKPREGDSDLLDWIAKSISDDEIANVRLEVKGIGTVRGEEMRIRKPVNLMLTAEGIPDFGHAKVLMHSWLEELLRTQQIPA